MNGINLSKDASMVFNRLYREYKCRLKQGKPKSDAAYFDSSRAMHQRFFPEQHFADLDAACAELRHAGLLKGFRADGYEFHVSLSNDGIIYGRTAFRRASAKVFSLVVEWIKAILSLPHG